MHPYRCQVCGETYLGLTPPDRCPFCGAAGSEIKKAALWYDRGKLNMSQQSRDNLQRALELEINNTSFYKCAADKASNQLSKAIFKRLMKQEMEHAELISKAMGIEMPPIPTGNCKPSDPENFIEAHDHEDMAINHYLKSAEEATRANETEVAYIFRHLSEIETEHLILTNSYK